MLICKLVYSSRCANTEGAQGVLFGLLTFYGYQKALGACSSQFEECN